MYLVVVAVDTPEWHADAEQLRASLRHAVAATDRLEHVYLETHDGTTLISLFLRAVDRLDAARLAEQLSRRSMASLPVSRSPAQQRWSVQSVRTL